MKHEKCFTEFCKSHGYMGKYSFNSELNQYDIVIYKGNYNGGAFLSEQEYKVLTQAKLKKS
ncbi:hypothetical protein KQI61_05780 [Anaerocolumna aminovalerica]|uniref:hypothetical protein n=1 Tax=Anaerocolumna aminovalerica TaxID=1527 RepID=UPI001C0EFF37|nr:hypothetical protein [Anaerocolumna aminovalerica]MBU5331699.1 hypothetical protein [Anaerocolumna aminovalerica]